VIIVQGDRYTGWSLYRVVIVQRDNRLMNRKPTWPCNRSVRGWRRTRKLF